LLTTTLETLANGARIRVARLAAKARLSRATVVLLHGYPDNLQIFGQLAPRLAAEHDVVAFDWPGMGESDGWKGGATPAKMAERLATILDHLGIDRAFIAGIDMGGQPALVFASEHAARTSGVIVMNSLVLGDEATSWEIELLRKFGLNRLILENLPRVVFHRVEKTFFQRGTRLPSEVKADLWNAFRKQEVRSFIVRMCAGYQAALPKLPKVYSRIEVPTLILWGSRDRHFPPVQGERLQRLIAGSEFSVVADGEHWMVWDRAEDVAIRVAAFIAKQGGSSFLTGS
jgi:abhydrolase domain-containing protein 6